MTVGHGVHPCHSFVVAVGINQTVFLQKKVGMSALDDIVNNVGYEFAIAFVALFLASILDILLDSPDGPQGNVRLLNLIDLYRQGLVLHELTQSLLGSLHDQLEVVALANGQRQAWHSNKGIACASLEPGIAGQQIAVVIGFAVVELVSGRYQAVVEVVARHTERHLVVEQLLELA